MKKKHFTYLLLFLLMIFVGDRTIGIVSSSILKKNGNNFYGVLNKSIKDTSDVFILGSSRAKYHYNSALLSSNMGVSVFNAGADGYGPFFYYAVLKERLKQNRPSLVIIDIPLNSIVNMNQYALLNKLHPVVDMYPSFEEIIKEDPEYHPWLMCIDSYKYNSTLYQIGQNLRGKELADAFERLQGGIKNIPEDVFVDVKDFDEKGLAQRRELAQSQLEYLDRTYNLCHKNGIKVMFVVTPLYVDVDRDNFIGNIVNNHFKAKGYYIYNFANDMRFSGKPFLFKDVHHMNGAGADLFTKAFTDTLKVFYRNNIKK